jgi:site-specific DNA-methyltransferase (adenine-specific)
MGSTQTEFVLEVKDCVDGMRAMDQKSVDIVVTSPPYNLGIKYTNYDDAKGPGEYLTWSTKWAAQVRRVLKDSGSFFLNLGHHRPIH